MLRTYLNPPLSTKPRRQRSKSHNFSFFLNSGRGMGGMQGSSGMSGPGGAAGGGSGPVSGGQPGAGDVGVPKVMQGDGRILSKQKLQELVSYIDSDERLDADAEDLLMLIADEFVESVTSFACRIAKHRKSPKLEVKDLQFHLDQNWGIKVPGFGAEEEKGPVRLPMNDAHRQRLQAVKRNRQK
jgi:transcription initiation factor TFIID subunit 12